MPVPEQLYLDSRLTELWPAACPVCLTFAATVREDSTAVWQWYENHLHAGLAARLAGGNLTDMPGLADARRALKTYGSDPGRWRVSSEALYRRVRQGKELYHVNTVVDVNNIISLETGCSLGSYDLDRVQGEVHLRLGAAGESYAGIGKSAVPLCGLPVLCDDEGPFGSPVSDSERTMVRPATRLIMTVIFGFSGPEASRQALTIARERFAALAGARDITAVPVC